ncbi:MAG: hypothetical protein GF308_05610 [Candidatus Heimdallarchaeota archaeon]|nr:hypothetical protein [Candidatus Heimdallarchaeota archaeon]
MKTKKLLFVCFVITLFLVMPAFQGKATISPEDLTDARANSTEETDENLIAQDETYEIDGNTIRVEKVDEHNTRVYLNETYRVDIAQYDSHSEVNFYELTEGLNPDAVLLLISVKIETNETSTSFTIKFLEQTIIIMSNPSGDWFFYLNEITIIWSELEGMVSIFYQELWTITITETTISITHLEYESLFIERIEPRQWRIELGTQPPVDATYVPDVSLIVIFGEGQTATEVFVEIPSEPTIGLTEPITISFIESVLLITYGEITIAIHPDKVVVDYIFISIVVYIYEMVYIERIVIIFYEITIIYYITIVELVLVIIYESIEIKIYITKITIIYYQIEITVVFVSIEVWYIFIIWHFDIWVVEIEIWILIFVLIVQPVIIRFIPIFIFVPVPVIVPVFIPVFITQYVYIYIPVYPRLMLIDVANEDLQMPTHTIDYNVTYIYGFPVNDANVTVDYNGTTYPTTFQGDGIYRVQLPASTEKEPIIVTAKRAGMPDAKLIYDLEISWEITTTTTTTTTQQTSIPVIIAIASLFSVAIAAVVFRKKKKNELV